MKQLVRFDVKRDQALLTGKAAWASARALPAVPEEIWKLAYVSNVKARFSMVEVCPVGKARAEAANDKRTVIFEKYMVFGL
jgi:hypothetical protein